MTLDKENTLLVVDDDPYVLESISTLLRTYGYIVHTRQNAREVMDTLAKIPVDMVLTDIKMPEMTGIELLAAIHARYPQLPVILMTAFAELDVAVDAIKEGAFDFVTKPYNPGHLAHSVDKAVQFSKLMRIEKEYKKELEQTVRTRTTELAEALTLVKNMSKEIIQRLTSVAEYRDTDTGIHIARIGLYSKIMAEAMGMSDSFVDMMAFASPMHDLGKIGIPDNILLKPGALTKEEFEIMKMHTTIGEKMLRGSSYEGIEFAASVALNHHERWDGTGYPRGLKKDAIPVEGRIVMPCEACGPTKNPSAMTKPAGSSPRATDGLSPAISILPCSKRSRRWRRPSKQYSTPTRIEPRHEASPPIPIVITTPATISDT